MYLTQLTDSFASIRPCDDGKHYVVLRFYACYAHSAIYYEAIIGSLTQLFFAWRVKVLTNSIPAVAIICICAICQFCEASSCCLFRSCLHFALTGGGLGTSIAVGMIPEFVHFQKFEVIVIIWLAFSAVADCAITIALVWHLVRTLLNLYF